MQEREEEVMEILILNWRDQSHPQGGGSEVFAERVAEGLVRKGHKVTIFCAQHENAPSQSMSPAGVRIVRGGGRLTVYAAAFAAYWRGALGRPDVIVDVQNGLPFLARLWSGAPVVLLCHHVHREQWAVVMGPRAARFGWWVESRLSPAVHRSCDYVTVSDISRRELSLLGVSHDAIHVVHNGVDVAESGIAARCETPVLVVLGRLVPHKRVEFALETTARLLPEFPDLRLLVVGRGWWQSEVEAHAARLGLDERQVTFEGWVDEPTKDRLLSSAWISLVPSLKEGWGIAVMEAAAHGTPSVAFRDAGGVAESIIDGQTGVLVDDLDGFVEAVRELIRDRETREEYARQAREHARLYTWDNAVVTMEKVLSDTARDRPTNEPGPSERVRRGHIVTDDATRTEKADTITDILASAIDVPDPRVLDDGCGSGVIAQLLGTRSSAVVVAVDRRDQRTTTLGHSFAAADGAALPFRDDCFDVVVSNHVLEHVGDARAQLRYLQEARRVLRRDGALYLAVPNKYRLVEAHYGVPLLSWLPQSAADRVVRSLGKGTWYDVVPPSKTGLLRLLTAAGFDVTDVTVDVARRRLAARGPLTTLSDRLPASAWTTALAVGPTHVLLCRPAQRPPRSG